MIMSEVEDAMENEFDGIDKYDLVEEILESRIKLTGLEITIAAQAKEIEAIKTDRDARKALLASVLVMFGKYIASEDRGDLLESMQAIEQALKGE